MTKLNFLHVCDNAFLSQDNKLNLIGVFNAVYSTVVPINIPHFNIVVNLNANEEKEHETIISIMKEDEIIFSFPSKFKGLKQQIIQTFLNFPFNKFGEYKVEVKLDDKIIGSSTITVFKKE